MICDQYKIWIMQDLHMTTIRISTTAASSGISLLLIVTVLFGTSTQCRYYFLLYCWFQNWYHSIYHVHMIWCIESCSSQSIRHNLQIYFFGVKLCWYVMNNRKRPLKHIILYLNLNSKTDRFVSLNVNNFIWNRDVDMFHFSVYS